MKKKEKKQTCFLRAAMMVLTTILIVLFFAIMSMVGKIQGTARVINYAGLVRGGTQRMVKLEISGTPQDKMYQTTSSYIEGLRNGSDELNFIRLDDQKFQSKMDELAGYFLSVKRDTKIQILSKKVSIFSRFVMRQSGFLRRIHSVRQQRWITSKKLL